MYFISNGETEVILIKEVALKAIQNVDTFNDYLATDYFNR